MKTKFFKALVLKNKQRGGVALVLFLCLLSFPMTPGSAQSRNQKRITGLQLGEAAEGSRVTIVSDSGLSDYEAFRRGDRFYVKIPLAELKSALPRCCANGFEDVQVQKVGDGLLASFRLQAGATARVDQRSNRLDVIFSSPNRAFRNPASAASGRVAPGPGVFRPSPFRGPDAAGPMPPGSIPSSRQRVVTERARALDESRVPQNARVQPNLTTKGNTQPRIGTDQPGTVNQSRSSAALAVPSPAPSSSPVGRPSISKSYPALTIGTPAASPSSQPGSSASTVSGSPSSLSWKTRGKAALQWVSANRLATLLGVLILLSLIVYLAIALRRRRNKLTTAKRFSAPKVQPKPSSGAALDELLSGGPASSNLPREVAKPEVASAAGAAAQNHSWGLTKPSVASPSPGHERGSGEEDREVFEL